MTRSDDTKVLEAAREAFAATIHHEATLLAIRQGHYDSHPYVETCIAAINEYRARSGGVGVKDENGFLPCPFCGGDATLIEHEAHEHSAWLVKATGLPKDIPASWSVECVACSCGIIFDTRSEAIAAWNRRSALAPEPAEREATAVEYGEYTPITVGTSTADEGRCRWPDCQCYNPQGPQTCSRSPPAKPALSTPGQGGRAGEAPAPDRAALIERLESRAEYEDNGGCCDRQVEDVGALLREAIAALRVPDWRPIEITDELSRTGSSPPRRSPRDRPFRATGGRAMSDEPRENPRLQAGEAPMTTEAEKKLAEIVATVEEFQASRSAITPGLTNDDYRMKLRRLEKAKHALSQIDTVFIADGFTALKAERDRLHEADLRWGKLHQRVIDERAAEIRAREAAETALATAKARIAEMEGRVQAAREIYWLDDVPEPAADMMTALGNVEAKP